MDEQKLKAIETRLVNRNRPLQIGDQVQVVNFANEVIDEGEITSVQGVYVWLNGLDDEVKPEKYAHHMSGVHRVGDNVSSEDDIRALLDEIKVFGARISKVENLRPPVTQDGYAMGWLAARDEVHKILFGKVIRKPIPQLDSMHIEILAKLNSGKVINGMNDEMFWFKRGKMQYSKKLLTELKEMGFVDDDCKITHSGEVNLLAHQ